MDIIIFINSVKMNECLWNMKCLSYKDKYKKAKAWESISEATGVDAMRCIGKWKYLRDKFVRELKREKVHRVASRWSFFEHMQFINEFTHSKTKHFIPNVTTSSPTSDFSSSPIVMENSTYEKSSDSSENDEDILFGKQVVCKLKKLNNIQKSKVKIAILETFFRFESESDHKY
uniref:Transcription factor Adf-1 n=1 Tax=Lepeophtheirus salmonis TaxID=72036 RepID=D3PHB0_LEPSM|nr:Transcription factor Adf-1 [Lepeophtheirus salmonis]